MTKSSPLCDPPLPFPIKVIPSAAGPVQLYDIPDDQKEAILEQLYIFRPVPALDDVMEDIHAEKRFRVREFLVAREGGMNVLASPYYLESGGTVIDWEPVRRARKGKRA
jgi:hypothetical protein